MIQDTRDGQAEQSQRRVLIWGGWAALGLFFAGQVYLASERPAASIPAYKILLLELGYASLWALCTPLVFALGRRYRLAPPVARGVVLHTCLGALFGLLTRLPHDLAYRLWLRHDEVSLSLLSRSLFFFLDYGVLIYWLLLLIDYTGEYNRRLRAELQRSSTLETQLAQAQLNALKMQLQPHFLFNTLNSISALLHQDAEAADRMIARLGDLLRLTLDNSRTQEVTLARELEYLKCYLGIEEIRFQERLSVELQVEPASLRAKVPNLLLQPIVENAIKHGISKQRKPGKIVIRAERRGEKLWLQVEDNGPGASFDESSGIVVKQGFGLTSTKERLIQRYGEERFSFEISAGALGGCLVTFTLPLEE